eukprot:m.68020 g.68020  ORF g.68020 m.68020 type:complete len:96 (-) comp19858_c0_seq1:22-309(-)
MVVIPPLVLPMKSSSFSLMVWVTAKWSSIAFSAAITEPLPSSQETRDYLNKTVNPTLTHALTALCKEKPDNPLEWLADWLINNNPNKPRVVEPDD